MRSELRYSIASATGTAVVLAIFWSATSLVGGQAPGTYRAPRTADGHPNFNGFWQALNTANWDIEEHGARPAPYPQLLGAYLAQPAGLSVVEGGTIPYKPEALANRNEFFEKRLQPDVKMVLDPTKLVDMADPEAKCFEGIAPRVTYMPFPFQILQTRDKVVMLYEYAHSSRVIFLGDDLDKTFEGLLDIDSWQGQSGGRWDGETLIVETRLLDVNFPRWLDRAGNFYSPAGTVVERYTATSPHHLLYEVTIEDPTVFTRPLKMSMPLYRRVEPNMELLEFECIPFAEEFMYAPLSKKRPSAN